MTLPTTGTFVRVEIADGAASAEFDFNVEAGDDVFVRFVTEADPDPDWLAYGVDYAVTLNVAEVGGTVAFTPALEGAGTIEIERRTGRTQERRFRAAGRFPEEAVEFGLDRQAMVGQELEEKLARALYVPRGAAVDTELSAEAGRSLRWNADGDGLENYDPVEAAAADLTFPSVGVKLWDTDESHVLYVRAGSNLSADRTLTLITGDAARTLDVSAANVTISAAGAALIDDASAAAQRATLGLGTMATQAASAYAALAGDNSFTGANVLPKPKLSASSGAWTLGSWGKAAEIAKGCVLWWPKGGTTNAIGVGVSEDVLYFLYSSADDDSAAGGVALSINTVAGSATVFGNALFHGGVSPLPSLDNAIDLGSASFRFATVYAATGTINTSDAREKTALAPLPVALKAAVRTILAGVGTFQWLASVVAKGEAARTHVGVTAQAVDAAFAAEGLDAAQWGVFCADPVEDRVEETNAEGVPEASYTPRLDKTGAPALRLGLRYDQLTLLALAVLAEDVAALKAGS